MPLKYSLMNSYILRKSQYNIMFSNLPTYKQVKLSAETLKIDKMECEKSQQVNRRVTEPNYVSSNSLSYMVKERIEFHRLPLTSTSIL